MDFWTNGVAAAYNEANDGGAVSVRAFCLAQGPNVQAQGRVVASDGGDKFVLEGVCDQPSPDAPQAFPGPDGIYFWVNSPKAAPENTSVHVQFQWDDEENTLDLDHSEEGAVIIDLSPTERQCEVVVQDKDLNDLSLTLNWSVRAVRAG
jgi:hypothetical protein